MGNNRYNRNKQHLPIPAQKPVTDQQRELAAERLNKMSIEAYGDGASLFTGDQLKNIMETATRNILRK